MDQLRKIRAQVAALNAGIVPFGQWGEEGAPHHDFTRILAAMDPAEARKHRRAFRKAWRKIAKAKESSRNVWVRKEVKTLGLHKPNPTRREKNARKYVVTHELMKEKNPA
jgi:hypothetical protein